MNQRILVLGADGSLGGLILNRAVERLGVDKVIAGFYKNDAHIKSTQPFLKTRQVDVSSRQSLTNAVGDIDLVISAAPQKEPLVQLVCAENNVSSVDVGAHYLVAQKALETIDSANSFQLVCAGQAPGVTGLMAKKLYQQTKQPIEVGFLLANRGRSGRAGVADMLRIIDTSPKQPINFEYYRTGKRRSVPAEHNEMTITRQVNVPMESVVAFESNFQNEIILGLRRLGLLKLLYGNQWLLGRLAKPNKDTTNEAVYLGAVSAGQRIDIRSESDYLAAAHSAVALAELACEKDLRGVTIPSANDISLDEVVAKSDGVMQFV